MPYDRTWIDTYFEGVHRRFSKAKHTPKRSVRFTDGTRPLPNRCHVNVKRWVSENPGAVRVRGWLIQCGDETHARYIAHSVVRYGGETFDITPMKPRYKFIRHAGTAKDFNHLEIKWSEIGWPFFDEIPTAPDYD